MPQLGQARAPSAPALMHASSMAPDPMPAPVSAVLNTQEFREGNDAAPGALKKAKNGFRGWLINKKSNEREHPSALP